LLEALRALDPQDPLYALDVLTLVESVLENPRVILMRQLDELKTRKMVELKAQGVEYDQRIEELDKLEHPKPNADFIYATFDLFAAKHPWVGEENIRPKSIAREMYERCMSFVEYVREYGLERSEGVLLRYLSDCYRTLVQTVPINAKDEAVRQLEVHFRTLLAHVDDSLVREWEELVNPSAAGPGAATVPARPVLFDPSRDPKAFAARVRTELHLLLTAISRKDWSAAADLLRVDTEDPWDAARLERELAPFFAEKQRLIVDHGARMPHNTLLDELAPRRWRVRQVLVDPSGDNDWALEGEIDLTQAPPEGSALVALRRVS
jgi:hypothetical protein